MSASTLGPAPAPISVSLARGILARLALWPALQIAVAQSWGGPDSAQKRSWLAGVLVDAFEESQTEGEPAPDAEYVETMLLQIMEDEFDCMLEDGSAEGVARDIVKIWNALTEGAGASSGEQVVLAFEVQAEKMKGRKIQVEEVAGEEGDWDSDSGDEDDGMEVDGAEEPPQLLDSRPKEEPMVDEDGFTLVKGKGKARQ